MQVARFACSLVVLAWTAGLGWAQVTTVQLPTYGRFGVGTAVTVPDRGSVYLGGINRARSGSSEFGTPFVPLRNRSFGSDRRARGASVSVYIHDFEAMDEMLLGQPAEEFARRATSSGAGLTPRNREAWPPEPILARARPADPPAPSVAEIRAQRSREQEARNAEAKDFFERGQVAEEAGKTNVARVYYQMAARRASASLKEQVAARLEAIGPSQPPKLARAK